MLADPTPKLDYIPNGDDIKALEKTSNMAFAIFRDILCIPPQPTSSFSPQPIPSA